MGLTLDKKELTLKDGRKVVVRQLTALDEFLSLDLLGEKVDAEDMGKAFLKQLNVQVAMSVFSVDGERVERPKKFDDVLNIMIQFKKPEWAKITTVYNELNGDAKEEETPENFTEKLQDLQKTQSLETV